MESELDKQSEQIFDDYREYILNEAAGAFLNYSFETIGLERIVAIVFPGNKASIRVIEKIGLPFVEIVSGLAPELSFFEDVNYFELSRKDYLTRRNG